MRDQQIPSLRRRRSRFAAMVAAFVAGYLMSNTTNARAGEETLGTSSEPTQESTTDDTRVASNDGSSKDSYASTTDGGAGGVEDTSGRYALAELDIRYFTVPGAAFRQYDGTRSWRRNNGYGGSGWADDRGVWFQLFAPVQIQARRARIFELRCTHRDDDAGGSDLIYDAYVLAERLVPSSNAQSGLSLHVSVQTSGATGAREQAVAQQEPTPVDNETFSYYLVVDYGLTDVTPAASLDAIRLYACQVGYIVDEP